MEKVLITGAARRVGKLIAKDLAGNGCFVWIHYRTHEEEAYLLKNEIEEDGGHAACISADLADCSEIDRMLAEIAGSENGGLTALINNASIIEKGNLGETTPESWDRLMNTNLKSVWYLSARFAETVPSAKRIITIGDAAASSVLTEHAVYGLSKFALKYLTEQLAVTYAPKLRANLISPGLVMKGDREPFEVWNSREKRTLTDNRKIVDELLMSIRFLMNDPGLTGTELLIDNGLHLWTKNRNMM